MKYIVETKRYIDNTFIENVILDKMNNDITPYTKVYDILEIIFEHITSDFSDIKPNSLGYVFIYNDFLYENLYMCQKTYFENYGLLPEGDITKVDEALLKVKELVK